MRKVFTLGYTVYLASVALGLSGMGWWVYQRTRPLTIEDMARPDYQDSPDRILRKIDRDGVLHDLRPSTKTLHEGVPYATNSDGMRDDHDYSIAKIPGRRRLMFLGDSFTFGWGLRLEYSFVKQVEALLGSAQWEVLNLGVPAYNTLDEVALFEMKGLKYSPDIVILMYHLNDAQSVVLRRSATNPRPSTRSSTTTRGTPRRRTASGWKRTSASRVTRSTRPGTTSSSAGGTGRTW
jgi:lysophospholipase L1-like esterase